MSHRIFRCEIEAGMNKLTDIANLTFPRNVSFFDKQKVREVFRRGDPVQIQLGYDDKLHTEFEGYITEISADIPINIKCEDEMWKLKQLPVNFSREKVTIEELLKEICKGYEIDTIDRNLGGKRYENKTVANVLDDLKNNEHKLESYMRGKTLVCGKIYAEYENLPPVKFHLEKGIVDNRLRYWRAEDINIKIKGESTLPDSTLLKYEFGDDDGVVVTKKYYNIDDVKDLRKMVKLDYDKINRNSFEGSFTAFGVPRVLHGMKAELESDLYPERNGVYYIESVVKTFSQTGYRQKIKLGYQV